jgi:hypothetical protein
VKNERNLTLAQERHCSFFLQKIPSFAQQIKNSDCQDKFKLWRGSGLLELLRELSVDDCAVYEDDCPCFGILPVNNLDLHIYNLFT